MKTAPQLQERLDTTEKKLRDGSILSRILKEVECSSVQIHSVRIFQPQGRANENSKLILMLFSQRSHKAIGLDEIDDGVCSY